MTTSGHGRRRGRRWAGFWIRRLARKQLVRCKAHRMGVTTHHLRNANGTISLFPKPTRVVFWTWPAKNLKPADMLNLRGKYHTHIVLEIEKSYKRLTLYDGRKVNLLFSAAREGHQKRRSQTPIPHTTVLLSTLFCGIYLLLPCFALPQRVCTCLSSLTFLLAGKT